MHFISCHIIDVYFSFENNNSELEQLQNEKRKALLEHETAKLRECDEALQRELKDWKAQLLPRKQVGIFILFNFLFFFSFFLNKNIRKILKEC